MKIAWGEWTPDRAAINIGGLRVATNVRPDGVSYEPMPAVTTASEATDDRPRGMFSDRDILNDVHTFVGDETKLYELSGDTWTDVSRAGGYTCSETDRWRFARFGDRLLATNFTDEIQKFDMTTDTAFDDLAGTPPKARFIAVYGDFVLCGNTATNANSVRWSGINDSEEWTIGTAQSDVQDLPDGGAVTGLAVSDVAYIFQENKIRRMLYTGGGTIMQFDVVDQERGLIASDSLCSLGRVHFYLSEDGFYQFDGGSNLAIGYDKIDSTFKADVDRDSYHRISSAVDPVNKLVGWLYPSKQAIGAQPDTLLIYNWANQRWAKCTYTMELLSSVRSSGYTLEQLDALYSSIDAMTISLDDPIWTGGAISWGGMSHDYKLATFSGANLEATLETDDFEISEGLLAFVDQCRPLIDAAPYCRVGTRMRAADAVSYSTETLVNVAGYAPQRALGRYLRMKMRVPAATSWTKTQGIDFNWTQAGMR